MRSYGVLLCLVAAFVPLPVGCNEKESDRTSTSGGATGAGGSGTGSANAAGGKSGGQATGGNDSATGGASAAAGSTTTGGKSGAATGGALATGGTSVIGGQSSGASAGSTPGPWRPFNDQSPWNTKIPPNPELDPDSDALVADFASNGGFWININDYGIPAYYAAPSTPLQTVSVVPGIAGVGFDGNQAQVPIPAGAVPDPESDHHMCVVDSGRRTAWDMWNMQQTSSGWTCSVGATIDLLGTGVRPLAVDAEPWYMAVGARASGFPLIAGLILVDETKAGTINHALVVAYPTVRSRYYVSPASTAQGTTSEALPDRGIPCGGHLQLNPALDVESLGLSATGKAIARAMQEYGLFVGDYSGSISLYVESAPASVTALTGVLGHNEAAKIPTNQLRLLKLGPLNDYNN
jgi:hypothetical protein